MASEDLSKEEIQEIAEAVAKYFQLVEVPALPNPADTEACELAYRTLIRLATQGDRGTPVYKDLLRFVKNHCWSARDAPLNAEERG